MDKFRKKIFVLAILLSGFFVASYVMAATPTSTLPNPIGPQTITQESILTKAGGVLKIFIGFSGSVALAMFVYGGFIWLTSAGEAAKIKTGRDIFLWAAIGLVVVFNSYLLLDFVLKGILSAAKVTP